jgi:hypothetical protein
MLAPYPYLVSVREDQADHENPKGDQDRGSPRWVDAKSDPDQAEQGEALQCQVSKERDPMIQA